MLVVDSQVHMGPMGGPAWPRDLGDVSLTPDERRARRARGHPKPNVVELLDEMQRAGVDAALLVCTSPGAARSGSDDEASFAAARAHPETFGCIAALEVRDPGVVARLDELQAAPEVLGVRVSLHPPEVEAAHRRPDAVRYAPHDVGNPGQYADIWDACVARAIPVTFNAPGLTGYLEDVARAHPDLKISLDHMSFGGIDTQDPYDDLRPLLGPLLELAELENVAVKASGLPGAVAESYPFPKLQATMREVIGAFGAHRVHWGSNLSRAVCGYDRIVGFFAHELDFLSDDEVADLLGRGLVRWLGWSALESRT
jgi:predicted TIM-barrel fold metal-dependent hydrolase